MAGCKKWDPVDFTHLACEIITIGIMSVYHVRKIGLLVNKSYCFINKLVQVIPQCFFWAVGITSTGHPYNPCFPIYDFHFSFIGIRYSLINDPPGKKIYLPDLWMKRKTL